MTKLVLITLLAAGCTTDEPAPSESRELCTERMIGDPSQVIELAIVSRDRTGNVRDVADRAPVELVLSDGKQGLALSVRARNLDGCAIAVVIHALDRDGLRAGTMVQLDTSGRIDRDDPLQFVELADATPRDELRVVIQDAHGRVAAADYSP